MESNRRISLILLIVLSCSVTVVSCARYNFITIKDNIDKEEAEGHYIDGLLFTKQTKHWCGPAALASVLQFWQEDITQDEIAERIYLPNIKGTLTFDLENYAHNLGYFAQSLQSDTYDLGEKIRAGIPVIVMHQILPFFKHYHYLVVFGYDDTHEVILAYTGKEEPALISYFNFIRKWKSANNWMLIVCPPEKVSWSLDAYYSNRLGLLFEKKGDFENAQKNYQKARNLDATNPTYVYNLANIYLKEKDYHQAILFYNKAISLNNQFADAYNNLAYCLQEINQDLDEAQDFVKLAISLNPANKMYYLDTLGMVYLKKGLVDEAISSFNEALTLIESSNDDILSIIYLHLAEAAKIKGNLEEAQDYFDKSQGSNSSN